MGRKGNRNRPGLPETDWDSERSMAAAEEEEAAERLPNGPSPSSTSTACLCGHRELLLEAYLRVVDGALDPEPLEVGRLTCPECGREYEAIQAEGGRVLRGDFVGYAELEE